MKTITFFNNKGGVGKTTLAVNLASYYKIHLEKKILFMDLDPQANSTQSVLDEDKWLEIYGPNNVRHSIFYFFEDILAGDSNIKEGNISIDQSDSRYGFDLIPGHPKLSFIEDIFSDAWNRCSSGDLGGFRKSNWLNSIKKRYRDSYDYLFIDLGPSLGALNRTVLLNTDYFITPMGADIFSILGIDNISSWMEDWQRLYNAGLSNLKTKCSTDYSKMVCKYNLNDEPGLTTKFIGFSIQQYVTKMFATGQRPIKAYDEIISQMPSKIVNQLKSFIKETLTEDDLLLGNIPFLYSIVPLSQTNKVPIFNLEYKDGLRGNQKNGVEKYLSMMKKIAKKINENIGIDK